MAAVGVAGYAMWAANGGLVKEGNWLGVDFHTYYQAARVLGKGEDIYSAGIAPPYVYPPLLAILVLPIALLNVTAATMLWKLLQHLCLFIAGWLLVRLLPRSAARPLAAGILLLCLLTAPLQSEIRLGESNSLVLLLIVGAVYLIVRRDECEQEPHTSADGPPLSESAPRFAFRVVISETGAALLLAVAVSIKVLPVLLLAYFWWRGPRTVAAIATAGFLALQLLSQLVTPATAHYWFGVFPDLFGQAFPYLDNQSINATISRALLPTDPTSPNMQMGDGELLRSTLTWVANLMTVGATVLVLWAARRHSRKRIGSTRAIPMLLEVGLVLLTTHLVSGSTWLHHLVAISVPITALIGAWWLERQSQAKSKHNTMLVIGIPIALGIAIALLIKTPEEWLQISGSLAQGNSTIALVISSTATLVVIGLWLLVAVTLVQSSRFKLN